jgi:hypothetical protein
MGLPCIALKTEEKLIRRFLEPDALLRGVRSSLEIGARFHSVEVTRMPCHSDGGRRGDRRGICFCGKK